MSSTLFILISALIVIAAIILILVVLVQNSKGGGLSASFSSSNSIMGVRKTTDFVEKATWTLAGFIIVMSLISTKVIMSDSNDGAVKTRISTIPGEQTPGAQDTPDVGTPMATPPAAGQE
ncbi:preprotein translocase subunit SecG [Dysgonomonas sp. 520]|uniref:preprotein translocase subunit SecG n=1 Tax=Dysgonomonas sp. 520 TaxID=2302931 RepID=UPI0013D74A39|nr:preprotein translocase subunit SecG [Dysgonomonas sp. 520]NDW10576.1 preprotein translocase subunit SecG [Dysgonomonas sp. 520]